MGSGMIGALHDTGRHDRARHDGARNDGARNEGARNDIARDDAARRDVAWNDVARHDGVGRRAEPGLRRAPAPERTTAEAADRFVDDQLFEEDVRAVVAMMRPHRRERLLGWAEYRTGGANFRATISWDESFQRAPQAPEERWLAVPRLTDVLESILVGSLRDPDELTTAEEFEIYRGVVRELYHRLDEMQSRYE